MSDLRTRLAQLGDHVRPAPDAFERLERHRRRRVRNRRIGAAVVALSLALLGTTGVFLALREDSSPATIGGTAGAFAPIWPETTYDDAIAVQDRASNDPAWTWRYDAGRTATEFAGTALGWSDPFVQDITIDEEGVAIAAVVAPPVPCPSPAAGETASPLCIQPTAFIDLRRVAPGGIWEVVNVRGQHLAQIADTGGALLDPGASLTPNEGLRFSSDGPDGTLEYVAVTGVGDCRGWEMDSVSQPMLVLGMSLPLLPSQHPDGCDVVVFALAIPASAIDRSALEPLEVKGLGQDILFNGSPSVPLLDVLAIPLHIDGDGSAPGDTIAKCDGEMTLFPDSVQVQADGVHVALENATDTDLVFTVLADGVSSAETVPAGSVRHEVLTAAPGSWTLTCGAVSTTTGQTASNSVGHLQVLDPDHLYVPSELQCESGSAYGSGSASGGNAVGEQGSPLDVVRSHVSGLTDADALERAGYPEGNAATFVIVRDGRVVGSASLDPDGNGGWLLGTVQGCGGTAFGWDSGPVVTGVTGPKAESGASGSTGAIGSTSGSGTAVACGPPSSQLTLVGTGLSFDTSCLSAPANTPLTLRFTNADDGIEKNVSIYPLTRCLELQLGGDDIGCNGLPDPIFRGELVRGPDHLVYDVPALDPGKYYFQDDVHPASARGVLVVS